jgi:hypothetical protein
LSAQLSATTLWRGEAEQPVDEIKKYALSPARTPPFELALRSSVSPGPDHGCRTPRPRRVAAVLAGVGTATTERRPLMVGLSGSAIVNAVR